MARTDRFSAATPEHCTVNAKDLLRHYFRAAGVNADPNEMDEIVDLIVSAAVSHALAAMDTEPEEEG